MLGEGTNRGSHIKRGLLCKSFITAGLWLLAVPAVQAGSFSFWDIEAKYTLVGNYAAGWRLEEPSDRIINSPTRESVPIAEELKFPESNNHDDGNRNFDKHDLVVHRASLLGDIEFRWKDYGLLLRGDLFYDDVYANNASNAHDAPDRINTTQDPFNSFTDSADEFSGARARLLDAYVYGDFYFGDTMALQVRLGRHIAAWGQTLFFNGLALSQATADATRATVPGAEVKSILLPTNQVSFRFTLNEKITLLGQYQFEFKPFELNPVGEFYSPADVVGPGREFAYGIRNPFDPSVLASFDLTDQNTLAEIVMTVDQVFDEQLNSAQLQAALQQLPIGFLPSLFLPELPGDPLNAPRNLGPSYAGDIEPDDDDKQYGFGIEYAITDITLLGAYYLRYHQKTPTVQLNYGQLTVIGEQEILPGVMSPNVTTADLGLLVPETYNIRYFDNVDLYAIGFSTVLFGINWGGEFLRREGVDVLVDVDNGVNGLVPTPTRANTNQVILNGIYTTRPQFYFDTLTIVGELGWIQVEDVEPQQSNQGANEGVFYDDLTFKDEQAYAAAFLAFLDKRNVFAGWDLRIPISLQRAIRGRAPLNGAFGSLFDERDTRVGIGAEFTRLQKLTLGVNYSGFTGGDPHFFDRPLADRDTISVNAKYTFF
ncbi:MAG: DUF1302 domain-containing protein [Nevskiales bacterium]